MSDAGFDTTIGAILAISASTFNAVGYTVQKKGHNSLKEYNKGRGNGEKRKLVQEKTWGIGFGIYLIGGLLNAVSLFYAPQSLVLPLSAITLVVNTILATKVLNEPFHKADILGMLSVIIGSVLAVKFGPRTAGGEQTMNDLKIRWSDRDFFLFFIILSACIVLDYLIVRFYEGKNAADDTVTDKLKHGSQFLLISYCLLAGYFGSLAFLFLKSFTEFIGSSTTSKQTAKENASSWYTYFTLICVILTNFLLEFWRQRGLSYFHAVYVVPINQVILIVMGTILGGIYFQEFDAMTGLQGSMFSVAILMTVIGVFILAFNSGNVSDKTEVKINHTISISFDPNVAPTGRNLQSGLQTSPSLPITRALSDEIPQLPPPGMAGTIARIHGLHSRMATMHFTQDGKPFYLDKHANKLAVLALYPFTSGTTYKQRTRTSSETPDESAQRRRMQISRHVKHSQSLPTYSGSNSALELPTNGALELELDRIEEEKNKNKAAKNTNGKINDMNGYQHTAMTPPQSTYGRNTEAVNPQSLSGVEIITRKYTDECQTYEVTDAVENGINHSSDDDHS